MKLFRRPWDEIKRGENIDLYVAVPTALVLAVLTALGAAPQQWVASITLLVLSLLAISLLGNRHRMEQLSQKLGQPLGAFLLSAFPPEYEGDFANCSDLWIVGVSSSNVIGRSYQVLEKKLRQGHSIYALLVNPSSAAVRMSEARSYVPHGVERDESSILGTGKDAIAKSLRQLSTLANLGSGRLQIRTMDYLPGHGMIAVNPNSASGRIYVKSYSFRNEGGSIPKFVLKASDGIWFDFYRQELINLWEAAEEWHGASK